MGMSSVKFGIEIKNGVNNARVEDIQKAASDLVVSLLFLLRTFGVSGVTVTVTRGDFDE